MKDFVYLGPSPSKEDCAQVGIDDYVLKAREECTRYIELIRKIHGAEPKGAMLKIKYEAHDLGTYLEVICQFEDNYSEAVDYAYKIENESPQTWEAH